MLFRALACLSVVALAGCGAEVDGVFGNDGSGGSGGQSGQTGGVTNGAAVTNGTATGQTSSVTSSVTSAVTTGGPTTNGPGPSTSTGPDPLIPTVFCAGGPCEAGEICCYHFNDGSQDFCGAPNSCPNNGQFMEIECNGPDDCPGQECCGVYQQGWKSVTCENSCGGNELQLCYGAPAVCEQDESCVESQQLGPGYAYCGGN